MKRRGFMIAVAALVPVAVLAGERPRRRLYVPPRVSWTEYRRRGDHDYMRVQRTYWRRPTRTVGPWGPCPSWEFSRAYPTHLRRWRRYFPHPQPTVTSRILDKLKKRAGIR